MNEVIDPVPFLTNRIIKILNDEIAVLIKGQIYKSQEDLINNIERLGNFCIQDTHPEMYQTNRFMDDKEMENYLADLKFFANNGGFSSMYIKWCQVGIEKGEGGGCEITRSKN